MHHTPQCVSPANSRSAAQHQGTQQLLGRSKERRKEMKKNNNKFLKLRKLQDKGQLVVHFFGSLKLDGVNLKKNTNNIKLRKFKNNEKARGS